FLVKRNILAKKNMTILILIYLAFSIRSEIAEEYNRTSLRGNERNFEIALSESVKIDGDLLTVQVELTEKKEKLAARYKIKSETEQKFLSDYLKIGMTCRVNGTLRIPPASTNPNSFSYKDYLN